MEEEAPEIEDELVGNLDKSKKIEEGLVFFFLGGRVGGRVGFFWCVF